MSKKYRGVRKNNKGKIYYEIEFSVDPETGDRKRVRFKSYKDRFGNDFTTEKQAYDEVCRIRTEYNLKLANSNKIQPDIQFTKFMKTVFLPYYITTVQTVTYQTAYPQYKRFIDIFGDKNLSEITVRECEEYRLYLIEKYSPNYAKGLWCKLKKCFEYAERLDYIKSNPCRKLDNPKGEKSKTEFWTIDELKKVLRTFDQSIYEERQFYTTIWLYFMTGMRVSEGLSLKWSDVDLVEKVIHIQSTLEYQGNSKYIRKEQTKTSAGMRYLEIDDETVKVLENWRSVQVYNGEDDFVLARFNTPMNKSTLSRMLKRHALMVNVPIITGKGLRHSHDSFMINVLKKDVLFVSARSGRTDKATTLNTYSHFYNRQLVTGGSEITEFLNQIGLKANPAKLPPKPKN